MRIAVTGCSGYVGNVLVRYLLANGHSVRGMDTRIRDSFLPLLVEEHPLSVMLGSVTNLGDCAQLVNGCDAVIHLAAIVGAPACNKQPELSFAVNINGTNNMVCVSEGRPFVFASTGSVYGKIEGTCTEKTKLNPVSIYGNHKAQAESYLGSNAIALRFATAFGYSPQMRLGILPHDLLYQAIHNRSIGIFEQEAKRTFIHVKDMARSLMWALGILMDQELAKNTLTVFNVGCEKNNWTKGALASYIGGKTKCIVSYGNVGHDQDARDYYVSYEKLEQWGFNCERSVEDGIYELMHVMPYIMIPNPYA